MRLVTRDIDLIGNADRDQGYMEAWEENRLDADSGAVFMSDNNRIKPRLTKDEFVEVAHKCGYWKEGTLPYEIAVACENYRTAYEARHNS